MLKASIKVEGLKELLSDLSNLGVSAEEVAEETAEELAYRTHDFAVAGIKSGAKTGHVYDSIFRTINGRAVPVGPRAGNNLSATHRASAPGEYPASDTGQLLSSVLIDQQRAGDFYVGTALMHGKYLEFGTSKMAARPWLLPSFEKAVSGVERELKTRLDARL